MYVRDTLERISGLGNHPPSRKYPVFVSAADPRHAEDPAPSGARGPAVTNLSGDQPSVSSGEEFEPSIAPCARAM